MVGDLVLYENQQNVNDLPSEKGSLAQIGFDLLLLLDTSLDVNECMLGSTQKYGFLLTFVVNNPLPSWVLAKHRMEDSFSNFLLFAKSCIFLYYYCLLSYMS